MFKVRTELVKAILYDREDLDQRNPRFVPIQNKRKNTPLFGKIHLMQFCLLQQIGDLLFIPMSILIDKQLCLFPSSVACYIS